MTDQIRSAARRLRRHRAIMSAGLSAAFLMTSASLATAQPLRPETEPPAARPGTQAPRGSEMPFRLKVEVVDFGVVRPHVESRTELEIFNASRFPITVTRVTASCSCMGGIVEGSEIVQPGAVGKVEIAVKGRANLGPIRERVTVWYVDPESGRERSFGIPVTGEVAEAVKAEPFFINLLTGQMSGSIDVSSTDGTRFRVVSFMGKAPVFDASKLPEGDTPGREATTRTAILYDFTNIPEDQQPEFALLETDHPESPLVALRILNRALLTRSNDPTSRPWSISQDHFNLGRLSPGETLERKVTIVAPRLTNEFAATIEAEQVGVEVLEVADGAKGKEVLLRFTMQSGGSGMLRSSITLTNGPEKMTLPLFVLAAPGA